MQRNYVWVATACTWVLLGILMVATLLPQGLEQTTSASAARQVEEILLLPRGSGWVLSVVLGNPGEEIAHYRIQISVGGEITEDEALVRTGARYSHVHRIAPQDVADGLVRVQVFQKRNLEPLEEMTYVLK